MQRDAAHDPRTHVETSLAGLLAQSHDGATAFVRGCLREFGPEGAGRYHAVGVAVAGDGDFDEEVVGAEGGGDGDGVDCVGGVELDDLDCAHFFGEGGGHVEVGWVVDWLEIGLGLFCFWMLGLDIR